jgi:peptidoglycan/xylan/chitin deacetylase (PgdA/CDA1 family)
MTARRFLVCLHDATPAYARETKTIIRELAPLLGRRLSIGVVPDWHGEWPLGAHRDYCRMVRASSDELLLHGYFHRRQRGWGLTALFAGNCDEMNGLDPDDTRRTLERGQRVFADVFGEPARVFLAPAWQLGHVRVGTKSTAGLEHLLGFFSLESRNGRNVPLATFTWDCSRWAWPGHVGHGIGRLLRSMDRGVPTLAIHPRDIDRGFWPKIRRLTEELLEQGYEARTPSELLEGERCSSRLSMPSWSDERVS